MLKYKTKYFRSDWVYTNLENILLLDDVIRFTNKTRFYNIRLPKDNQDNQEFH